MQGTRHGFLKHNAFAKQLVRTEQIPMITGVNDDCVLAQSRVSTLARIAPMLCLRK